MDQASQGNQLLTDSNLATLLLKFIIGDTRFITGRLGIGFRYPTCLLQL